MVGSYAMLVGYTFNLEQLSGEDIVSISGIAFHVVVTVIVFIYINN